MRNRYIDAVARTAQICTNSSAIVFLVMLACLAENAYAYGVVYSAQVAGGATAGGFNQSFCTGLLPVTSYTQPFQVFEANDTFERSGTMSNEALVQLGQISLRNSGSFSNQLTAGHYGGGTGPASCLGGVIPHLTQWNDTMTVTGSGMFAFTVQLESQVTGSPVKISGTATHGVEPISSIEAILKISSGIINNTLPLRDQLDDGDQGIELRSTTLNLNLTAGDVVQLVGTMQMWMNFSAREGDLSWDMNAINTANFYIDPISPGAAYSTESGVSYVMPIPVPAAFWLFSSALGLLGWMKHRAD